MGCCIGLILYAILQFVAFVFVLVGTPIDMFRSKKENVLGNTPCLTLWGMKTKCYSTKYDSKLSDTFGTCTDRINRFRAAEAFAILSIIVFGVACLIGFIMLCCCSCLRWLCLVLNILGIATACITWALMVDAYYTSRNTCPKLNITYKYGAGLALFVVGWCLDIIDIIFLMLPC